MKVWIDQDLCTGDGLCEEIAPGLANVPGSLEEAVIEAAEECPGECIFIEVD
jgi:ferredoxin